MPLLSRGCFDEVRATVSGPAADDFGLTEPQPFSVVREVTRMLQPVPLRFEEAPTRIDLAISGLSLTPGSGVMLRRVNDRDVPLYVLGWSWDLSGAAPVIVPGAGADAKEWTVGLSGNTRELGGVELPLVLATQVVGILAVRLILWQSDRGADQAAVTQDIRDSFAHTRLSSVLSTLAASPATMMTTAGVREAAGELGREIAPVLRALCTDYIDFFEGFYRPITDVTGKRIVTEDFTGYQSRLQLRATISRGG